MSVARKAEATCLPAEFAPPAGGSKLHRTATTGGHAIVGKFFSQGEALWWRPVLRRAAHRPQQATANAVRQAGAKIGWVRAHCVCVEYKLTWPSNTKVSRPSRASVWLGPECKSNGANPDA